MIVSRVPSVKRRCVDRRLAPALAGVLLVIASLKPNGLHEQYFVIAVPFFALCAAMAIGEALAERGRRGARRYAWRVTVAGPYLLLSYPSWGRKWNLAIYDPYDMATARPRTTELTAAVVHRLSAQHPGPILPTWPGSALGSGAQILPGFEDHPPRQVADKLTVEERLRYHVTTIADLATAVISRAPSVVVLDRELPRSGRRRPARDAPALRVRAPATDRRRRDLPENPDAERQRGGARLAVTRALSR